MRRSLSAGAVALSLAVTLTSATVAHAANPGWECIPTTAGKTVTSGGIGAAPKCSAKSTPVLAPTYVANGVGGQPTVQFSAVNVQIVNGVGTTNSINGQGNLILGYATNAYNYDRSGSHNLILGDNNGWSEFESIALGGDNQATGIGSVAIGAGNVVSGDFALADGSGNTASGPGATVFGADNTASGSGASVLGGSDNAAKAVSASVAGGEYNVATDPWGSILGGCDNRTGTGTNPNSSSGCVTDGSEDQFNTVSGGAENIAEDGASSVAGGNHDTASGANGAWVAGGTNNVSNGNASAQLSGNSRLIGGSNGAQVGGTGFNP